MPRPMIEVKYFAPINVMAAGVMYATTRDAGIALGVSARSIWRRINNPAYPDHYYIEHGMWTTRLVPDNSDVVASPELKAAIRERAIKRETHMRRKVYVNGAVYDNQERAAAALGVSSTTIRDRIKSPKYPHVFLLQKRSQAQGVSK